MYKDELCNGSVPLTQTLHHDEAILIVHLRGPHVLVAPLTVHGLSPCVGLPHLKVNRIRSVHELFCGHDGFRWIGTENQGLCLLVEDKVTVLLAEDGLSHREVKVTWHDPDGKLLDGYTGRDHDNDKKKDQKPLILTLK